MFTLSCWKSVKPKNSRLPLKMSGVVIDQYPSEAETETAALATENILIIRYGDLKDFIQALVPMSQIKAHHPNARITLMTERAFVDVASKSGYFDEILVDPLPPLSHPDEWHDLYKCFNSQRFTRVYDLQMNWRSWVYYRLFRKRPTWVGMLKATPFFYDRAHAGISAARRYNELLKAAGIERMDLPDLSWMEVDVSFYGLKKSPVLLAPGAWGWSGVKYAGLALKLSREGHDVAVIGGDDIGHIVSQIRTVCADVHDLTSRTSTYDIASLSRHARVVIGDDTSAAHLAALMNAPVVVLLSAEKDASLSAPMGADVTVIQAENLEDISVADVHAAFKKRNIQNAG